MRAATGSPGLPPGDEGRTDEVGAPLATGPGRRRGKAWVAGVVLGVTALVIAWTALAGRILVAGEDDGGADVVVVPSGDGLGERLSAGADAIRERRASRLVVFLSGGRVYDPRDEALAYLASRGVSRERVRIVPAGWSTAEEAGTTAALAERCGWTRLAVVTSPFHTRRARWTFRRAVDGRAHVRLLPSTESFDPWRWWASEQNAETVAIEWVKLIHSLARHTLSRPAAPDPGVEC